MSQWKFEFVRRRVEPHEAFHRHSSNILSGPPSPVSYASTESVQQAGPLLNSRIHAPRFVPRDKGERLLDGTSH